MLTGNLRIEPDNELGTKLVGYRTDCAIMAHYMHTICTYQCPALCIWSLILYGLYINSYTHDEFLQDLNPKKPPICGN